MREYIVITFESTHQAIKAEAALSDIKPVLMPTLRQISASCGMSLKIESGDFDKAVELLIVGRVEKYKFYKVSEKGPKDLEVSPIQL